MRKQTKKKAEKRENNSKQTNIQTIKSITNKTILSKKVKQKKLSIKVKQNKAKAKTTTTTTTTTKTKQNKTKQSERNKQKHTHCWMSVEESTYQKCSQSNQNVIFNLSPFSDQISDWKVHSFGLAKCRYSVFCESHKPITFGYMHVCTLNEHQWVKNGKWTNKLIFSKKIKVEILQFISTTCNVIR